MPPLNNEFLNQDYKTQKAEYVKCVTYNVENKKLSVKCVLFPFRLCGRETA